MIHRLTRIFILLTLTIILCGRPLFAAEKGGGAGTGSDAAKKELSRDYRRLIRNEKLLRSQQTGYEKIVSGVVALGIGVYGYYFDQQNTGRLLAYSATQTAGVFMISNSLLESETPSLLLSVDQIMRQQRQLSYNDYRKILVSTDLQKKRATYKQVAYSSSILSALYAFNSFQERKGNITLRNVFGFLSVNFAIISGASFYQLSATRHTTYGDVNVSYLPVPTITMNF